MGKLVYKKLVYKTLFSELPQYISYYKGQVCMMQRAEKNENELQ